MPRISLRAVTLLLLAVPGGGVLAATFLAILSVPMVFRLLSRDAVAQPALPPAAE